MKDDGGGKERGDRLQALWLEHVAGESPAGSAELAEAIRAGGPLADALRADDEIHRLLDALGRSAHDEQAFVDQVGLLASAEASSDRFVSAVDRHIDATEALLARRRGEARAARPPRRWALVLGAPVVALAAAAALALWVRSERATTSDDAGAVAMQRTPTVASGTLTVADGARLGLGQEVPEGAVLASDQGRSCVRLADTSQICLERATRVTLAPRDQRGRLRVAVDAGKVAAAVAHQRPGETFTIGSAAGDVTAVGTAFSVELGGERGAMTVRVVEGAVRVERRAPAESGAAGAPVLLRAHRALAAATRSEWRMTSEEERDEWSLVRADTAQVATARPATPPAAPQPAAPVTDRAGTAGEGATAGPGGEVSALLALADALRARGRLRDARAIGDRLARRHPGHRDVERMVAELRLPPPVQPWNATPAVYRINAGGERYVDPRGNVWAADTFGVGGVHSGDIDEEIDGTDMDPLYRCERVVFPRDKMSYHLPLEDGEYVVRLHFAEIWAGTIKRNMRKFDVAIEGETVLAGYDIAAEVGPMTATVKQVVTTVRDGTLDIEFAHVVENPKISGIEVFALAPGEPPPPAPAPPTVFPPLPLAATDALYRVNAGGREYVDPEGRRWEADAHFNDTGLGAAKYQEIAGTDLDPLYQTERRSFVTRRNLVYSFPLPPGRYLARLHFAVLHPSNQVGVEVFDVLLEQTPVLKALNVFAEAGMFTALIKEVETTVSDGALDLSFGPIAGRPNISAIEILPLPATAPPPGAGCGVVSGRAVPGLSLLLALAAAGWLRLRLRAGRRAGAGAATCGAPSTR